MKKFLLLLLLLLVLSVGAFAETPEYFAFEIGAGAGYDIASGVIAQSNQFGLTYAFNDTFAGGFSFITIGGNNIDILEIAVAPIDNMSISMYMGQVAAALGFGTGIGYDFFVKSEGFFTSFGVYLDWYASNGATYAVANGGVFNLGLKTKIGL